MTDSASALALRSRWLAFLADVTSRRGVGSIWADRAFDSGRSRVRTRSIAKLLELLRDLRPTPPCSAISGIKVQLLLVLGLNWLRAARIVAPATFPMRVAKRPRSGGGVPPPGAGR